MIAASKNASTDKKLDCPTAHLKDSTANPPASSPRLPRKNQQSSTPDGILARHHPETNPDRLVPPSPGLRHQPQTKVSKPRISQSQTGLSARRPNLITPTLAASSSHHQTQIATPARSHSDSLRLPHLPRKPKAPPFPSPLPARTTKVGSRPRTKDQGLTTIQTRQGPPPARELIDLKSEMLQERDQQVRQRRRTVRVKTEMLPMPEPPARHHDR
jgi:hypothetical protein